MSSHSYAVDLFWRHYFLCIPLELGKLLHLLILLLYSHFQLIFLSFSVFLFFFFIFTLQDRNISLCLSVCLGICLYFSKPSGSGIINLFLFFNWWFIFFRILYLMDAESISLSVSFFFISCGSDSSIVFLMDWRRDVCNGLGNSYSVSNS